MEVVLDQKEVGINHLHLKDRLVDHHEDHQECHGHLGIGDRQEVDMGYLHLLVGEDPLGVLRLHHQELGVIAVQVIMDQHLQHQREVLDHLHGICLRGIPVHLLQVYLHHQVLRQ